jgi:ABC-2 type transport system ATP-binding protein
MALEAEGLSKRFGALLAVDGLSLSVREGEIFGFLGPNGAGKTTSISMMCGLLASDSGRTLIFGKPMAAGEAATRARVGVCPQSVVLWPRLTCLEQLVFMGEMYDVASRVAKPRAEKLLAELGLGEKRNALARTLSGGMQRRLSIGLALIHEPDIVVLDEPEAGLDPQSRVLVREYIATLAHERGKTIIFTTHNMDEAERIVDRVAVVDHGKLLELDTPAVLKTKVGGGDTLDVALGGASGRLSAEDQVKLKTAFPEGTVTETGLVLRERGIADRLAGLLETVRGLGLRVDRISLRESTLEDVFIALTGRELRS